MSQQRDSRLDLPAMVVDRSSPGFSRVFPLRARDDLLRSAEESLRIHMEALEGGNGGGGGGGGVPETQEEIDARNAGMISAIVRSPRRTRVFAVGTVNFAGGGVRAGLSTDLGSAYGCKAVFEMIAVPRSVIEDADLERLLEGGDALHGVFADDMPLKARVDRFEGGSRALCVRDGMDALMNATASYRLEACTGDPDARGLAWSNHGEVVSEIARIGGGSVMLVQDVLLCRPPIGDLGPTGDK